MNSGAKNKGFAIALAWPQTYCKQPGSWYDPVAGWFGINRNNYYRAGHAALVLIDIHSNKCHYFDFGRYHSPFQHGRARSADTDHDLAMETIPQISSDGEIVLNFKEILTELQLNPACHGDGELHASYCTIDFRTAYNKALEMQRVSPMPYGPFTPNGSNCSRFVNTVLLEGKPSLMSKFRLKYFIPFTPTPLNNVNSLQHKHIIPVLRKSAAFVPLRKLNKHELESTLPQPERHSDIPGNAQWLSGEGVGSWFAISQKENHLSVTRLSPDGKIECTGLYELNSNKEIMMRRDAKIIHPSNCQLITIQNGSKQLTFEKSHKSFPDQNKHKISSVLQFAEVLK